MRHAGEIGFGEVIERGVRAVEGMPAEVVYAGFSLGVVVAQNLAQTGPAPVARSSSTPGTSTTSLTARCPRTTPTQRRS